jgi:hypothetical protein
LQKTEQLDLQLQGDFADLIQEERSAAGGLNAAFALNSRMYECPVSVGTDKRNTPLAQPALLTSTPGPTTLTFPSSAPKATRAASMLTPCVGGAPASATAETLPTWPMTSKLTVKSTVPPEPGSWLAEAARTLA